MASQPANAYDKSHFMYWDMFPLIKEKLSDHERLVIGLRLQGYTLKQVGDVLGRSTERGRQIESKGWAVFLHALQRRHAC